MPWTALRFSLWNWPQLLRFAKSKTADNVAHVFRQPAGLSKQDVSWKVTQAQITNPAQFPSNTTRSNWDRKATRITAVPQLAWQATVVTVLGGCRSVYESSWVARCLVFISPAHQSLSTATWAPCFLSALQPFTLHSDRKHAIRLLATLLLTFFTTSPNFRKNKRGERIVPVSFCTALSNWKRPPSVTASHFFSINFWMEKI